MQGGKGTREVKLWRMCTSTTECPHRAQEVHGWSLLPTWTFTPGPHSTFAKRAAYQGSPVGRHVAWPVQPSSVLLPSSSYLSGSGQGPRQSQYGAVGIVQKPILALCLLLGLSACSLNALCRVFGKFSALLVGFQKTVVVPWAPSYRCLLAGPPTHTHNG